MKRVRPLAIGLALLLVVGGTVSLARHAPSARDTVSAPQYIGKVLLHCSPNANQQVDPIRDYGVSPTAHMHTPIGSDSFSATEVPSDMLAAQTSCFIPSDHNGLWFPTPLKPDGTPATLIGTSYYLGNKGYDITTEPPNGLRFIAGNASYLGRFGQAEYICVSNRTTSHTIPTTAKCPPGPNGQGYEMLIQSAGQCWYSSGGLGMGMGADTPDAQAPPANITNEPQDTCLANGGQIVPLVILAVGVGADGIGGQLSSDLPLNNTTFPGSTLHFDFVYGFMPAADGPNADDDPINLIDQQCLNDTWNTNFGTVTCIEGSSARNPEAIYQSVPGSVGLEGAYVTN